MTLKRQINLYIYYSLILVGSEGLEAGSSSFETMGEVLNSAPITPGRFLIQIRKKNGYTPFFLGT